MTEIKQFIEDFTPKLNSVEKFYDFFKELGYKTLTPDYRGKSAFDIREKEKDIVKQIYSIANYDKRFQIFLVELKELSSTVLKAITFSFEREIQYPFFVFTTDYQNYTFTFVERIRESPGVFNRKLVKLNLDITNPYHTDKLVLSEISVIDGLIEPSQIYNRIQQAFSVEKVTKKFFDAYKHHLKSIKDELSAQNKATLQQVHSFAQQLLSRIMFLYFVQKKGWLKWKDYRQDKRYVKNLWEKYKSYKKKDDTFYSLYLSNLFFQAFNKKQGYKIEALPDEIKESFTTMPYLNGGLFTENELDEIGFKLPDKIFEDLFEIDPLSEYKGFLEKYNFTIKESEPLEVEVAVDPEMLGKVYESLISEEERGKGGIFYTPRIEIDYMCRLSLVEYLQDTTDFPKEKITSFVFDPTNDKSFSIDELGKISAALDKVKVVDPAVGSASFLVGMMNVLAELHQTIANKMGRTINDFDLKSKIISQNLYGVDVKDWAVMVGELRLWLSLIIETEEKSMHIYTQPLLPNLTFKIRQGDSLVEEIAGMPLSLRARLQYIPQSIKIRITELIDKKAEYFRTARLDKKQEIEELEHQIFKDIVQNEIKRLEGEITKIEDQMRYKQLDLIKTKPQQKELFREEKAKIEEFNEEIKKLKRVIDDIGKRKTKDYFLWEIDFAEIFYEKGGFDIVIGNPPYVRQEEIAPPLEREGDYNAEKWRELKRDYKDKLVRSVITHWGKSIRIDKKSDLYVYFYYHGLALLRPNGVFCFINSNSWLDVGYGAGLQEFLLKNIEVKQIIDNLSKRSFAESDVNTIIALLKRPTEKELWDKTARFVAFKKPFEEVINVPNLLAIEKIQERTDKEDFRVFPLSQKDLWLSGIEIEEGKPEIDSMSARYADNKWGGKYLRAPEIYFKILEKGKGKLVRLGDIAEVRAGIITGNNAKYYQAKPSEFDTSKYSLAFKSPREVNKILLKSVDAVSIIKVKNVPFEIRKAPLLWVDLRGDRHVCHLNKENLPFEHNFYGIYGKCLANEKLCLILNSTITWFFIEVLGRKGLGGGAIRLVRSDLIKFPCLKDFVTDTMKFFSFTTRQIQSVFEECGINPKLPVRSQEPKPLPDRKELDDIVFDILGLTEEERKEVYWAVCELVKNRLEKARSV